MKKVLSLSLAFVMVLALASPPVLAHEGHDHSENSLDRTKEELLDRGETLKTRLQEQKELRTQQVQKRLDEAKLKLCEVRERNIKNIMERSASRAENQIQLFGLIFNRVKNFYTEKGKVLANYDELVAAVEATKTQALASLDALKTIEPFDCSSNDPKGLAEDFKTALHSLNQDLHAYRTAVKNLIVGVKSVQGEESRQ